MLGAIGALPLVPLARTVGMRLGAVPSVPGAERIAGDIKLATFAEVAAAVVLVPFCAAFFGRLLPSILSRRSPRGSLSFEWAGMGMALSCLLWRSGLRPIVAVPIAAAAGGSIAAFVLAFRSSFRFRRMFTRANRRSLLAIGAAGASWGLARISSSSSARPLFSDRVVVVLGIALLTAVVCWVLAGIGGRASDRIRYAAALAWFPVTASAVVIAFPGTSPILLVGSALALGTAPWLRPSGGRARNAVAALLLVVACGWAIYYQPYGPVNLFEDGHALAFADAYLTGAAPFRDTFPVHGWGVDGGADALFFRWFGETLGTFRARLAVFTALDLAALAVACTAVMGDAVWSAAAFLTCLAICPFVSERTLFAWVVVALLAVGVRRRRRRWIALAGAFAAVEVFFSLDMGLIVLVGGAVGLGFVAVASRRASPPLPFLAGAATGAAPLLAWLALRRGLGGFFRASFGELPRQILDSWGLPAAPLFPRPPAPAAFLDAIRGDPITPAFLVVLLAACAGVALFRMPWDRDDLAILPVLTIAIFSLRGVFGRADAGHAALYGVYCGIPAAWLLRRSASKSWVAAAVVLGLLWTGLRPLTALRDEITAITTGTAARSAAKHSTISVPRGGSARLPLDQAAEVGALRRTIDGQVGSSGTFLDFSNEPALYFLLGRKMPLPYLGPEFYETGEAQRQVIALCESRKPTLVIARAGSGLDAIDGVPNEVRAPVVARYLAEHYRSFAVVAGREILRRIPGR